MTSRQPKWLKNVLALGAVACLGYATLALAAYKVELKDPSGDDDGPGTYTYPTDQVYIPGSFDLKSVEIEDKGSDVIFKIGIAARIEDPWGSSGWGGNGFSLQHIQIYIDKDGQEGSGLTDTLPGIHAKFDPKEAWDAVVIVHAQGNTRVQSEVETKAPKAMAEKVVLPKKVKATGRTFTVTVSKADLGTPDENWGYQVIMQSNEGFSQPDEILTRRVNEYEGQHRFGGGSDYDGDPHFVDMLAGKAAGDKAEIEEQHKIMAEYVSDADPAKNKWVVVPMVYPNK